MIESFKTESLVKKLDKKTDLQEGQVAFCKEMNSYVVIKAIDSRGLNDKTNGYKVLSLLAFAAKDVMVNSAEGSVDIVI